MARKPFPTGTLVRYTTKFMRQIGSVTRPIDGLVLGTGPVGNLVAWSDGTSMIVNPYNLERAKKQLSDAEKKAYVEAERGRLTKTMEGYTKSEIAEIAAAYNGKVGNPGTATSKKSGSGTKRNPTTAAAKRRAMRG
jgi:hypothetical protein